MKTLEERIKKAKLVSEIESTASALLSTTTNIHDVEWLRYVIDRAGIGRSFWVLESIRETLIYIKP